MIPPRLPRSERRLRAVDGASSISTDPNVDTSDALSALVQKSLDDDQASELVCIDLKGKSSLADYMVIASGRSARHVASTAEHLVERLKEAGHKGVRIEGLPAADWVLLDIGDVIVHLFRPEVREFYNLERMWSPDLVDEPPTDEIGAAS